MIIIFYVGQNLLDPVVFQGVFPGYLGLVGNMLQKKPPHGLQADGNVKLIKIRLFFIQSNDVEKIFAKGPVPGLTLVDTDGREQRILNDRIYIFAVNGALEKSVNQPGIKGYGNVGAVLLIFHCARVKGTGVVKYNISFF